MCISLIFCVISLFICAFPLRTTNTGKENGENAIATMSSSLSLDSINLEESDETTEEIIKDIVRKHFHDAIPDIHNLQWRKKIVQLVGNYLIS